MRRGKGKKRIGTMGIWLLTAVLLCVPVMAEESLRPANPVFGNHSTTDWKQDYSYWSYVHFGSYPQSEILDPELQDQITQALARLGKSTGDVEVDGIKYRKIRANDSNDTHADSMSYALWPDTNDRGDRYFRWEPILWRVLDNDGQRLFLFSDRILDNQEYMEKGRGTDWEESDVRKWLNAGNQGNIYSDPDRGTLVGKGFFGTAFSLEDQEAVNKNKKVFLLTQDDVANVQYGFCHERYNETSTRKLYTTAYARAMGSIGKRCHWLLNETDYNSGRELMRYVTIGGNVNELYTGSWETLYCGVAPALYVDYNSSLWQEVDLEAMEITKRLRDLPDKEEVTKDDREAIKKLREDYNALSDEQKQQISLDDLKRLTDAEDALAEIDKKDGPSPEPTPQPTPGPTPQPDPKDDQGGKESGEDTKTEDNTDPKDEKKPGDKEKEKEKSVEKVQKEVEDTDTDLEDVPGSVYGRLFLKAKPGKKKIKLSWKTIPGADGYILFGSPCGTDMKKLATIKNPKAKSRTMKRLEKGRYYKYLVVAYRNTKKGPRVLTTSKSAHCVTDGGKKGNPIRITLSKSSFSLQAGETAKIRAGLQYNKKVSTHVARFRYESNDTKVVTVDKDGTIQAIGSGSAIVYVYAQNGIHRSVKVTVR